MRLFRPSAIVLCLAPITFAQVPQIAPPHVSTSGQVSAPNLTPGRAMTRFVVGVEAGGDLDGAAAQLGAKMVKTLPGTAFVGSIGLVDLPSSNVAPALEMAGVDPTIQFIEPVRQLRAPLEEGCTSTGALSGSGCIAFFDGSPTPSEYFDQPALAALDVTALYPLLTGNLSVVAVIDTGIDATHEMLDGRVLPFGFDFVDGDLDPSEVANGLDEDKDGIADEAYGHGTHVAGTIALLNPDARILPLRVLDSEGNGSSFHVAEAIHYAIASGADVINLSLGMNGHSKAVRQAIRVAHEADVVVNAAAGNSGKQFVQFPARMDDVIAVAAVDETDQKADFSAFGHAVELSAPGQAIYSTMPGDKYAWWSGTSMATAVASGATSLLHSLSGTPFSIKADDLLEDSSVPLDGINPLYNDLLGEGRIDPSAAAFLMFFEE